MKPTQEQIAALVKRLRNSGSRSEIEIHEDREEAADMLEQLAADNARLREALEKIADRPDYRLPKPQDIARTALQEKHHD